MHGFVTKSQHEPSYMIPRIFEPTNAPGPIEEIELVYNCLLMMMLLEMRAGISSDTVPYNVVIWVILANAFGGIEVRRFAYKVLSRLISKRNLGKHQIYRNSQSAWNLHSCKGPRVQASNKIVVKWSMGGFGWVSQIITSRDNGAHTISIDWAVRGKWCWW